MSAAHVRRPFLVNSTPDGSAFQVRRGLSLSFVKRSLALALREKQWSPIHGKKEGSVSRCVIQLSARHRAEMIAAGEQECLSTNPVSHALGREFTTLTAAAAAAVHRRVPAVESVELLKVLGDTPGQVWHMDSLYNAWAVTGCLLNGSPATVLGDYEYHPWPFNVGPNGMPREWDRLKELGWEWEAGDLIFF